MTITYRPASEVERIARDLIRKHYDDLDRSEVRIEYVFRSKASRTRGKTVYGKARKLTGLNAFLATDVDETGGDDEHLEFFVIEIAEDAWGGLSPSQRIALVDHELCHLHVEEDEDEYGDTLWSLSLRPHDLEEFKEIVERHGLWEPQLVDFADACASAVVPGD